jgi:hypothetical protein
LFRFVFIQDKALQSTPRPQKPALCGSKQGGVFDDGRGRAGWPQELAAKEEEKIENTNPLR